MKRGIVVLFIIGLVSAAICSGCSTSGSKKAEAEDVSDSSAYANDTVTHRTKHHEPTKEELKAMQEEEAKEEAREEYYSTDGDQADNPDFDDDIPGDEHDEEFIDNDGDPELYNE